MYPLCLAFLRITGRLIAGRFWCGIRNTPLGEEKDFQIHKIIIGPVTADFFPERGYLRDMFYEVMPFPMHYFAS